jgi:hypothetical protein
LNNTRQTHHPLNLNLIILLLCLGLLFGPNYSAPHRLAVLCLILNLLSNSVDNSVSLALQITVETSDFR